MASSQEDWLGFCPRYHKLQSDKDKECFHLLLWWLFLQQGESPVEWGPTAVWAPSALSPVLFLSYNLGMLGL